MAPHPKDLEAPNFDLRFRPTHRWLGANGYNPAAGYPNCHQANYNDGRGMVYGTQVLQPYVVDWPDVPKAHLQNLAFNDCRIRLATANSFAVNKDYAPGLPNFEQADYGQGPVCG